MPAGCSSPKDAEPSPLGSVQAGTVDSTACASEHGAGAPTETQTRIQTRSVCSRAPTRARARLLAVSRFPSGRVVSICISNSNV